MEISNVTKNKKREEELMEGEETIHEILAKLEKAEDPISDQNPYYCYQGFWVHKFVLKGIISFQTQFVARDDDILLASCPKSDFSGFPFSVEEENQGVPKKIEQLCSLENMKNLEVNKSGRHYVGIPNSSFYRKGEIGDWVNYLTPQMAERGKKLIQEKFEQSGLMFDF
ncbi:hypothetical protein F8388_000789 [Cannabis sativa]|uniref:Sulfotransferase n=1 Tax=Cannabis sativa TaxID=3483 RepID=A0A7J6E118_CANSA|nr:hypothetical protein F8388_000789 [Cannabis sativa]